MSLKIQSMDNDSSHTTVLCKTKNGGSAGSIYRGIYTKSKNTKSFSNSLTIPKSGGSEPDIFLQTADAGYYINYVDNDDGYTINITHQGGKSWPFSASSGDKFQVEIPAKGHPTLTKVTT